MSWFSSTPEEKLEKVLAELEDFSLPDKKRADLEQKAAKTIASGDYTKANLMMHSVIAYAEEQDQKLALMGESQTNSRVKNLHSLSKIAHHRTVLQQIGRGVVNIVPALQDHAIRLLKDVSTDEAKYDVAEIISRPFGVTNVVIFKNDKGEKVKPFSTSCDVTTCNNVRAAFTTEDHAEKVFIRNGFSALKDACDSITDTDYKQAASNLISHIKKDSHLAQHLPKEDLSDILDIANVPDEDLEDTIDVMQGFLSNNPELYKEYLSPIKDRIEKARQEFEQEKAAIRIDCSIEEGLERLGKMRENYIQLFDLYSEVGYKAKSNQPNT